tara:strand:- start:708 stop:1637 length:930 start_codon:yes stop_codon:yes gene_type:complete
VESVENHLKSCGLGSQPMKIVRYGNTEFQLLLAFYILQYGNESPQVNHAMRQIISIFTRWLYTTAGYYDKDVKGEGLSIQPNTYNFNYYKFIRHLEVSIGGGVCSLYYLLSPWMAPLLEKHKSLFMKKYNILRLENAERIPWSIRTKDIFECIKGRKVLVISSFDGLIKKQFDSGNLYKIHDNFPIIASLSTIKFPYCFHNSGPERNYHETLATIFNEIKSQDFDIALLACGCYGHMLCHQIDSELGKDAIYLGGSIQALFGILSNREKEARKKDSGSPLFGVNQYWITEIPPEYIPKNYKSIENGCYW